MGVTPSDLDSGSAAAATRAPRIMGALTVAYGLAEIGYPKLLGRQTKLGDDGSTGRLLRLLCVALGIRDVASGAFMVAAPAGRALDAAVAARCAFDLGDAAAFAMFLPAPPAMRRSAAIFGTGWAVLCAASGVLAHRRS